MGSSYSTELVKEAPASWATYCTKEWRSERAGELDRLGGLNRPPIRRGGSFNAKLQFLSDVIRKQGDDMQDAITPAQQPKANSKYSGYQLATHCRAAERKDQESERFLRPMTSRTGYSGAARPPSGMPGSSPRKHHRHTGRGTLGSSSTIVVAPWRERTWAARRRAMIIVLTMLRLRRGQNHARRGNKLDSLGMLLPKALHDDLGRFVDEQKKHSDARAAAEGAKAAMDELIYSSSAISPLNGFPDEPSMLSMASTMTWGRSGSIVSTITMQRSNSGMLGRSRQVSDGGGLVRSASLAPTSQPQAPRSPLGSRPNTARRPLPVRTSPNTVSLAAAAANAAAVAAGTGQLSPSSSMRQRRESASGGVSSVLASPRTSLHRLSSSGASGLPLAPLLPPPIPGTGSTTQANTSSINTASYTTSNSNLPGSSNAPLGTGTANTLHTSGGGGGGGGASIPGSASTTAARARRSSAPSGSTAPFHSGPSQTLLSSFPASAAAFPHANNPSPTGGGDSAGNSGPNSPAATTAQGMARISSTPSGALSSMASRRFTPRSSLSGGVVSTGVPAGRVSLSGGVAAKHSQLATLQAAMDAEAAVQKKATQMLSMYVNRANAAWSEKQHLSPAHVQGADAIQAFCRSDQFTIYRADVIRRLRQGTLAMQIFAGEDFLSPAPGPDSARTKPPASSSAVANAASSATAIPSPGAVAAPTPSSSSGSSRVTDFCNPAASSRRASLTGHPPLPPLSPFTAQTLEDATAGAAAFLSSSYASPSGELTPIPQAVGASASQGRMDVWTSDPWALVEQLRPGIMPHTDRIQGLSLGGRVLVNLVLGIRAMAGDDALDRFSLLLHVNEAQQEDVFKELWAYEFFGLNRQNVIIIVAPVHAGYKFDHDYKVFERDPSHMGRPEPLGTGYGMLQLSWAGEAFVLDEEGVQAPLDMPALQLMAERKIEWLVTRRARDLVLLAREDIIDLPALAYALWVKDHAVHGSAAAAGVLSPSGRGGGGGVGGGVAASAIRVSMVMEVIEVESLVEARSLDSLITKRTLKTGPGTQEEQNVELRIADMATPKMAEHLAYLMAIRDGKVLCGLGRYLMHVPSLAVMLAGGAAGSRPKLALCGDAGLVHVSLDSADLTAHDKARMAIVPALHTHGMLCSTDDLERLVPLLQAQDHDPSFRELLAARRTSRTQALSFLSDNSTHEGQIVVCFVVATRVSGIAVDAAAALCRPGRDCLHLVTAIPSDAQKGAAEELLAGNAKRVLQSMVDTRTAVIIRGPWGLLDVMERYVEGVGAKLVVMGSQHLTSQSFNYVVGSVTVSTIKRLSTPVMVVTANSTNIRIIASPATTSSGSGSGSGNGGLGGNGGSAGTISRVSLSGGVGVGVSGLLGAKGGSSGVSGGGVTQRAIALVEGHAHALLPFLCSKVLDYGRGDRLMLAQVSGTRHLTRQQAANNRRLVDNFSFQAASLSFPVARVLIMEGSLERMLAEASAANNASLVALQLPLGIKALPSHLVALLRTCRGAVLVVKEGGAA